MRARLSCIAGVVQCNNETVPPSYIVRSTISVDRMDTVITEEMAKTLRIPVFKVDTEGAAESHPPAAWRLWEAMGNGETLLASRGRGQAPTLAAGAGRVHIAAGTSLDECMPWPALPTCPACRP